MSNTLEKIKTLKNTYDKLTEKQRKIIDELNLLYKEVELNCEHCNFNRKVKDLVYIKYIDYLPYSSDDNKYYEKTSMFVCSNCTRWNSDLSDRPELKIFNTPMEYYFKKILTYYGDPNVTGELKELIAPELQRRQEQYNKNLEEAKLRSAIRTLQEAGFKIEK